MQGDFQVGVSADFSAPFEDFLESASPRYQQEHRANIVKRHRAISLALGSRYDRHPGVRGEVRAADGRH